MNLARMYGAKAPQAITRDKNPNRVLGGLKGAGVNSFTMLGEDETEKQIPTYAYVQALEEKLKRLEQTVLEQDKHIRRIRNDQKMDRQSY
jgi:hypothetical protein|tara:strand:+ start:246 stop:515 length:270 start_codon:yes stop_codon:yes gene_type:complete